MTAAELAAILDPEHEVKGWWDIQGLVPRLGMWTLEYIGPPDIHTAREHAWRMEDWLLWRSYDIFIKHCITTVVDDHGYQVSCNENHSAALVAAIERVKK